MKILLALLLLLCSGSFAGTIYVDGSGSASGICFESNFYFCLQDIKEKAKRSALSDADFRCSISQGRLEVFSETCYDTCMPYSYPNGQPSTTVNCRLTCRARCQVP